MTQQLCFWFARFRDLLVEPPTLTARTLSRNRSANLVEFDGYPGGETLSIGSPLLATTFLETLGFVYICTVLAILLGPLESVHLNTAVPQLLTTCGRATSNGGHTGYGLGSVRDHAV